ncbi:deoxyribodipyrimidine photo-lyase [Oscillatoria amoena NRMC-F 0135]|nr:deoxyribodipyrimidine photo-lyase [Oscillatoria amoena NRMC-F 0135]
MKRFENSAASSAVDSATCLFWMRRDLRLHDNAGLYHALKENESVLPIFIFDTSILDKLDDPADARVEFIHQSLQMIREELESLGSSMLVLHGNPVDIFSALNPKAVETNSDYEPYARQRDEAVRKLLESKGVAFKSFKDQVIFEKDEIVKDDGKPYTVYTPYSKKWKATLKTEHYRRYNNEAYFKHFKKIKPLPFPALHDIGFKASGIHFPERKIRQSVIQKYHLQRDLPALDSTSRLSVHLRFGTVSIRKLTQVGLAKK